MSIPRGTTPTNYFDLPADLSETAVLYLSYAQSKVIVIEKEKPDMTFIENDEGDYPYTISVRLTQEETLALNDEKPVDMQFRGRFPDGTAVESAIMRTTVDRILKDGVI